MFDGRTKLSSEVLSEIKNILMIKFFKTTIPRNVKLAEEVLDFLFFYVMVNVIMQGMGAAHKILNSKEFFKEEKG